MLILSLTGAVWLAVLIVVTSDGGVSVPDLLGIEYGGGCLFLAWAIAVIRGKHRQQNVPLRLALAAPILLVLGGAAYVSESAFFLRFNLSRAALNRYVAQVHEHPDERRTERRVGLFVTRETEVLPGGVVRIIMAEDMFDDTGVVFAAAGEPPVVGEDAYREMGRGWWRWWRSW